MSLDKKIRELAKKHQFPAELLKEAIKLEQEKVILQNRRMAPKLIELICKFVEPEEVETKQNGN